MFSNPSYFLPLRVAANAQVAREPRSVPRPGRAAQEVRGERRLRLLRGTRLSALEPFIDSRPILGTELYGVGTTVGTIEGVPHATGSRLNDAKETT